MSTSEQTDASARRGSSAIGASGAPRIGLGARAFALAGASRVSAYAWGAILATIAYVALTCWWLTQDRAIPIYDAGDHLNTALVFHQMLQSGNLLGPFEYDSPYPFIAPLVGALAIFVGGAGVAAPIIGENVVFVSLLTLGCYQIGKLLYGARAGMLAAILVLGSDLLTAQFHVFMIDAPEAALVSVSIWLLLACEDFRHLRSSAIVGVVVGVGLITKVQYAPFVMGIVLVMILRGGRRNWRGLATFAAIALVIGAPWYIDHLSQFSTFLKVSTDNPIVVPGDVPPTLSLGNFAWYFWNILNSLLLFPLFLLLLGGTGWTIATLVRDRRKLLGAHAGQGGVAWARLEFFVGAFVAWLFLTLTPSHDVRYGIPLMAYIAVIATGWIVHLPRAWRLAAIGVLALGVVANTFGTTFGVGNSVQLKLAHPPPQGEEFADIVTFYSTSGFLVAGPKRDGDVPGLLEALHRDGVRTVSWAVEQSTAPDFDTEGLLPLAQIAELTPAITSTPEYSRATSVATLVHEPVKTGSSTPCARLSDGTGVWVVRYDASAGKLRYFCPGRASRYYG